MTSLSWSIKAWMALSQLIKRALAGDEIVIASAIEPLVKLIPIEQDGSPRVGGFCAGKVEIVGGRGIGSFGLAMFECCHPRAHRCPVPETKVVIFLELSELLHHFGIL